MKSVRSSRGGSALPSRGASVAGSAAGSVAGSVSGSAAPSPRGTTLPSLGGAAAARSRGHSSGSHDVELPAIGASAVGSAAASSFGSPRSVASSAGSRKSDAGAGSKGTYKQKNAPTAAKDAKKDHTGPVGGRRGREAAKEERERKRAEDEKKAAEEAERKRVIKAQQDEMKRIREADEAVKAAIERRKNGAERLISRTAASLAASKALKEQVVKSHESALEIAAQAAWSRLYEAAKDNNLELIEQLLRPEQHVAPAESAADLSRIAQGGSNGKRQKLAVGVSIPVDWAAEVLRGGGGNDRGYWSVGALDVNAQGGAMKRTALMAAASRGHLETARALCDDYGADLDVQVARVADCVESIL